MFVSFIAFYYIEISQNLKYLFKSLQDNTYTFSCFNNRKKNVWLNVIA